MRVARFFSSFCHPNVISLSCYCAHSSHTLSRLRSREAATEIGLKLFDLGLFRHVADDRSFGDGKFFFSYR
jgi:hypothetical protein